MSSPVPLLRPGRARVWLQLLRAPNLFTVPGDPLVGYIFANGWGVNGDLPLAMLASVCFYSAGLLMNDLADEAEDLRDRPSRPLPSQSVSRRSVWAALVALSLAGLGALALTGHAGAVQLGGILLGVIACYNWLTKGVPILGALNMGLCRGLSVMLGGVVGERAEWRVPIIAAVGIGLFIAAVTNLARHETRARVPWLARVLPLLAMLIPVLAGMRTAIDAPDKLPAAGLFALAGFATAWLTFKMLTKPAPLPPLIGAHIRLLLPLQAASCYLAEPTEVGRYAAVALLCLWPVARLVSRWFYAS